MDPWELSILAIGAIASTVTAIGVWVNHRAMTVRARQPVMEKDCVHFLQESNLLLLRIRIRNRDHARLLFTRLEILAPDLICFSEYEPSESPLLPPRLIGQLSRWVHPQCSIEPDDSEVREFLLVRLEEQELPADIRFAAYLNTDASYIRRRREFTYRWDPQQIEVPAVRAHAVDSDDWP